MMKALFFRIKYLMLVLFLTCISIGSYSQNSPIDQQTVNQWVQNKQFVFTAQTATPQGGTLIQLNYPFFLQVKPDSLSTYLPYFGRAYTAPMTTQDAGINFTSTDFDYNITKQDEDRAEITIRTKDQRNEHTFYFTLFGNGQAQLQVISNNRQAISFSGYIAEKAMK